MRRRGLLAAVAGLAAGMVLAACGLAHAGDRAAHVEIRVIHATRAEGAGSVDPQLRDLPQLTRQEPFVRYNVFRLVARQELPFEKGKPAECILIDGRTLHVTWVDTGPERAGGRYHLRAEIAGLGKREFLKLLEVTAGADEPFFVGGQTYKNGTLFLEIVIRR